MVGSHKEYVPPKYEDVGKRLSVRGALRPIWPFVVGGIVSTAILLKIYFSGYNNEEMRRKSSKSERELVWKILSLIILYTEYANPGMHH
jgi:hypothetical protein